MLAFRKKRIAIQFFGHLRTFRETYQSFYDKVFLPNQARGYKIDIFMHVWDEGDYRTHDPISNEDIDFVKKNYNPKRLLIESQVALTDNERKISTNPDTHTYFKNYTYTIYKANQLRVEYEKDHNLEYDFVITTRPDIEYLTNFIIDDYLNSIKSTLVWLMEYKVLRKNIVYEKSDAELENAFDEKMSKTLFYASNPQPVTFN